MSFDGVAIANDGTVPFRQGERIGFSYLVSQKFAHETATVELLQQGKRRTLQVQLQVRGGGVLLPPLLRFLPSAR